MIWETGRTYLHRVCAASCVVALAAAPVPVRAQAEPPPALLQVEVGDSIGLPLPNATMEVFTLFDRGIVWEWAPVRASDLPPGIMLLRFSHPGYRPSVLSVPLRKGGKVSLRVRLETARDTTPARGTVNARVVRATGLALDKHANSDVIGMRRVITHDDIGIDVEGITPGVLMHQARNTDLRVVPSRAGTFAVGSTSASGGTGCATQVMINGDRRRFLPFATFDRMYGANDIEVIEIFAYGGRVPFSYQPPRAGCGVLVVWLKNP